MSKYILLVLLLTVHLAHAQDVPSALNLNPGNAAMVLPFQDYRELRSGLPHFKSVVQSQQNATVAFLGGSITFNPGWRDKICSYLSAKYPSVRFHFINAGIPSLGSFPHAFRVQRDVLDSGKIDLLFVEAAVNDRVNGIYGYDSLKQVRSLEGIIRHIKKNTPETDIVMMSFADPDKTNDYKKGIVPTEIRNHELVASHYHLPSINLAKEVKDKIGNGEFSWEKDFLDIHPSPFGQKLYFENIQSLLDTCLNVQYTYATQQKKLPKALNKFSYTNGSYENVALAIPDEKWQLNGDWTPKDGLATRDGFVHVPMLVTDAPDATLRFDFVGNAVGIAVVSGSDAGMIAYAIDDAPYKEMDLHTGWSNSLHLPWYVLLGDDLSNTKHTLHLKTINKKNADSKGYACRIVHFLVNK